MSLYRKVYKDAHEVYLSFETAVCLEKGVLLV